MMVRGLALATWASSSRSAPIQSPSGASLHWALDQMEQSPLVLRMYKTYPSGQPDPERVKMAVVNGLRAWSWALGRPIPFDLWEGQEEGTFPPRILPDEMNSIFWRSSAMRQNDPVANEMRPSQAAYTEVYFDEANGQLQGFDLVLNDVNFRFVSRQDVATGVEVAPDPSIDELYLEDTVLHELGHALGLEHTLDPDSVLFPTPRHLPGSLGCDDISSIRSLYAAALPPEKRQEIFQLSGVLRLQGGETLAGMGVMAVHQQNPKIRATTISKPGGQFNFSGLRAGKYALFAYPLSHLKRYFLGVGPIPPQQLCPDPTNAAGQLLVPAQWLASETSHLDWKEAQSVATPVQFELSCKPKQRFVPATASQRFPVELLPSDVGSGPVWGLADRFRNDPALLPNEVRHYRWTHPGGPLSINWMSDPVGALHSTSIAILKKGAIQDEFEQVAGLEPSLVDPDLHQLVQPELPAGEYLLSVQRNALRPQAPGLLGAAVPAGSYVFWMALGAPVQGCPAPPKVWPSYSSPSPWPPGPHKDRGCNSRGRSGASGAWTLVGLLLLLGWRRTSE